MFGADIIRAEPEEILRVIANLPKKINDSTQVETKNNIILLLDAVFRKRGYGINHLHSYDENVPVEERQEQFASPETQTRGVYHVTFSDTIKIETWLKKSEAPQFNEIDARLRNAFYKGFERLLVFSQSQFESTTRRQAERAWQGRLILIDRESLYNWAVREFSPRTSRDAVLVIVGPLGNRLARAIAETQGKALQNIEWRLLEQVIQSVFESLGFKAELTRCGKDKGRDVIIEAIIKGQPRKYLIEVKHWMNSEKRVGPKVISSFLKVILSEPADGGFVLSTSGFTKNLSESFTEIGNLVNLGDSRTITALCDNMVRKENGIFFPMEHVLDVLTWRIDQNSS
jgi:hypothetical protein